MLGVYVSVTGARMQGAAVFGGPSHEALSGES